MRIAVIGSRKTQPDVMAMMYGIMRRVTAHHDVEVSSGGCEDGPDKIATYLALQYEVKHVIYAPNEKRKNAISSKGNLNVIIAADYASSQYRNVVRALHPAPDRLNDWSWALHGRNLNIIAGDDLENPVDAVAFAGKVNRDGGIQGGTGMGVAYARDRGIPCFNFEDITDVIKFLELIKGKDV
jgi:hypothetical protein